MIRDDQLLTYPNYVRARPEDMACAHIVVIVHGWTADRAYVEQLADDLAGLGLKCLIFEYRSDHGVIKPANSLHERLEELVRLMDVEDASLFPRISFVAHSMGGLVIRYALLKKEFRRIAKRVVTLGTPHGGVLKEKSYIKYFVDLAEAYGGPFAQLRAQSYESIVDLTAGSSVICDISKMELDADEDLEMLSISGGCPVLNISKNYFVNRIANAKLQKLLTTPNDGIVEEGCSRADVDLVSRQSLLVYHFNEFSEYSRTNHTDLVKNQYIALKIARWLKTGAIY